MTLGTIRLYDGAMSEGEADRLVGAAYRRFRAANGQVCRLKSKIDGMARMYREIADLAESPSDRLVEGPDGNVAVAGAHAGPKLYHAEERDLLDTLRQYDEALTEQRAAKEDWTRISSC